MAKKQSGGYYVVHRGHTTGIYSTWAEAEPHIRGFANARHKKFAILEHAEYFLQNGEDPPSLALNKPKGSTNDKGKKRAAPDEDATDDGFLIVYCDGACQGNQNSEIAKAGIGVWWGHNDPQNCSKRCPGRQTNNRAELLAIHHILETTPFTTQPLKIKTDSQYTIKCFETWIGGWKQRGWRTAEGKPVINKEIIHLIDAQLHRRAIFGQKVKMEYVKAHVGIEGNEAADGLAVAGCSLPVVPEPNWDEMRATLDKLTMKERRSNSFLEKKVTSTSVLGTPVKENGQSLPAGARAIAESSSESPSKIRRVEAFSPSLPTPGEGVRLMVDVDISPQELADYADCLDSDDSDMEELRKNSPRKPVEIRTPNVQKTPPAEVDQITAAEWEEFFSHEDNLAAEISD